MKKTLLLLSLAGSLALPAVTHADPIATKTKNPLKTAVVQHAKAPMHIVYYITSTPRTGSAIPMVYRGYNGRIDSASNAAVYGLSDIEQTGALDVGTALSRLDSSISLGIGRR